VKALIASRHAVGVFVVPVATNVIGCLKAVVVDVEIFETLDGADAAGACTDYAALELGLILSVRHG